MDKNNMTDEEMWKRALEKTMCNPLRKFEIKLEILRIRNILGFIPSLFVFTGKNLCFDIHFKWLFIDLWIYIDWDIHKRKSFDGVYVIPHLSLYYLDKDYKEKFDFQFFWFRIGIRKFFGERKTYKYSLKDREFIRFRKN